MIVNIIKILSIIYCSLYVLNKITGSTLKHSISRGKIYLIYCMLFITSCVLNYNFASLTYFVPLLILWIIAGLASAQPQKSFVSVTLSFTISFALHALVSFIISFSLIPLFPRNSAFPYEFLALSSSVLHVLAIQALCNTKRFRKGMPFLSKDRFLNIATFICILLAFFSIFFAENHHISKIRTIGLVATILALAFLIYWWQAQITKSYRRSLELREQESKRIADLEKDILLQKVLKENERLAHITHRDNTLITTLKNATLSYLSTDYSDEEEALKARDELVANIEALSAGRTSLPDNYNTKQARTFDTNFTLLNKLLHQMDADAIQQNIMFSVHFGVMLDEFVPRDISEMDLVHTVDDLLKNAFKATRNSEPRMVQLQFYRLGKHFVVEVADNGIPFEVRSLVNMGMEKLTTYEDGSGIGLVDIWSTKEKCGATYHLEEYVTPSPFSKKISLTFDKKNRYSIRTWRKDEILQMSRRADLQVYEHME